MKVKLIKFKKYFCGKDKWVECDDIKNIDKLY